MWEYPWWNWPNVWLIIIIIDYSLYMIFAFWIHDIRGHRPQRDGVPFYQFHLLCPLTVDLLEPLVCYHSEVLQQRASPLATRGAIERSRR